MTSQPLDAVQVMQAARLRAGSLPPGVVIATTAPPPAPVPHGAAAEEIAQAAATVSTVRAATDALVGTHIDLAQQEAELKALENQERREDLLDRQQERAEERRERRRGGSMTEMFQVMQAMLEKFAGGERSEIAAVREQLAQITRERDEEARRNLELAIDRKYEGLAGEIHALAAQITAGGGSMREIERVKEAQMELRALGELFGVSNRPVEQAAATDVQGALLAHRLHQDAVRFEEDIADRRAQRELEHQRFLAEIRSTQARDEQVSGLIEAVVPALDSMASRYLDRGAPVAPAPPPPVQPMYAGTPPAPPAQPIQLPPEVALATCPACGGQAPIPLGYGDHHGVCIGCGAVVTVGETPPVDGVVAGALPDGPSADAAPPEPAPVLEMAAYRDPTSIY